LKKQLWQQTIQSKITNQAYILQTMRKQEVKNMLKWANSVRSGDSSNLEGRAAAYYWKNLFPTVENFVRSSDEMPPNNLLNYGYAILRAVIARSLVGSGLLPTLGIHHHNRYNAYCLADDIMEPYRPFVDKLVIEIVDSEMDFQELSKEIKTKLLQVPVLDVNINGQRSPLMLAASQTSASLAKCYLGEIRKIVYPSFE
jgi:CRISPR-associated protein Cas1